MSDKVKMERSSVFNNTVYPLNSPTLKIAFAQDFLLLKVTNILIIYTSLRWVFCCSPKYLATSIKIKKKNKIREIFL